MTQRTPLFDAHVAAGGKMVDFAGWEMPVNYGSQIEEHVAVRTAAGMFDVSHMTIIDVPEPGGTVFLQRLVANDVAKLNPDQALYGALLNEQGGVIDDLIVYRTEAGYRCVVNASTRDKVLSWFAQQAGEGERYEEKALAMIAVQGPQGRALAGEVLGLDLSAVKPFYAVVADNDVMVGRTGYTGEDGVEIMLPKDAATDVWQQLTAVGVQPAGLGARDTLRLEAGLNLYGQDLDDEHSPLSSNIGWTVAWQPADRAFIGRQALEAEQANPLEKLAGLVMEEKGVLRHGQTVATDAGSGVITSGTFSPTMQCSIALARIPFAAEGDCQVDIRGKLKKATIVQPPFVRNGKIKV